MSYRLLLTTALAFFGTSLNAASSDAWGDVGHEIVCEIAFQELTDKTRTKVKAILAEDSQFDTFSESCTWPDHPRRRSQEHYINVPRYYSYVGTAACRLASRCTFSAIRSDVGQLANDNLDEAAKLPHLKYLGHWIGDIHQPLHVSYKDDRGGNEIGESGPCSYGLHSVWDSCIVEKRILLPDGVRATAAALLADISDEDRRNWLDSTSVDWADESYKIATRTDVGYCIHRSGQCWYSSTRREWSEDDPKRTVEVDDDYLNRHTGRVRERLQRAGVRLAGVLNEVFDPQQFENE